jgi:hypothetical protein
VHIIPIKCVTLDVVLQVKMAAMECAPITRTRRMETEIPPHLQTVPVQLEHPMRAHHRNSACPDRHHQPHHLVAAAITTDIVPSVSHTIVTSRLLQQRRKCSMKVCLHNYYNCNVCSLKWNCHTGSYLEIGFPSTRGWLINAYRNTARRPEGNTSIWRPNLCTCWAGLKLLLRLT